MQATYVKIEGEPRQLFGKRARYLRRDGLIPANVSGSHAPSQAVQVPAREMQYILTHVPRSSLLSLVVGNDTTTVLVTGVDRKPTTGALYHVDFQRISMTEAIRVEVPLVLVGESDAARLHDATILHQLSTLHLQCLPGDLPTEIQVDLSKLAEVDDAIHVRDLNIPRGVTVLTDGDELIVKALGPHLAAEVEEAAEAAAPTEAEPEEAAPTEAEEEPAAE